MLNRTREATPWKAHGNVIRRKGFSPKMKTIKIIVEKHPDGYVAYPVGLKGVIVAEGDTYEEALADVKSAIDFHIETFGKEVFDSEEMASEVFIAETGIAI
jgi:predicted RNase H-like HicB family nuclease